MGKSTLFNALSANGIPAENYPFCTIEPNVGIVELNDPRLAQLAEISNSNRIVKASIEFTDIAGLVKGASAGEGLGNRFLGHIRETHGIVHVVRCFDGADVVHVHGKVDPLADVEVIDLELALADLNVVEKAHKRVEAGVRTGNAEARLASRALERAKAELGRGTVLRVLSFDEHERRVLEPLNLLTMKPMLYAANVGEEGENDAYRILAERSAATGARILSLNAQLEAEIAFLDSASRADFMAEYGMKTSGLARLAKVTFDLLGLQVFFTSGPKESKAWVVGCNCLAEDAAGTIHTDMKRGFIRAEVIAYDDFIACRGEGHARETGKLRLEGREYRVQEADVIHFRFNV